MLVESDFLCLWVPKKIPVWMWIVYVFYGVWVLKMTPISQMCWLAVGIKNRTFVFLKKQ